MADEIHPVDVFVGAQIRKLRKRNRVSQTALAKALGVTFQQIQKYEKGSNRISASKLFDTARALGVPVAYFFDELVVDPADGTDNPVLSPAALEIGRLCERLTERQRRAVRDLADTLGGAEAHQDVRPTANR